MAQADVEEADDEYACQKCGKADHPEWILLCDSCDKGWHCSCLRPALMLIPEGDWFCPPCQHVSLSPSFIVQAYFSVDLKCVKLIAEFTCG